MPNYNLPDPSDPQAMTKVIDLLRQLFEGSESDIKNFKPIATPEEGLQHGSIWFDSSDSKFKVNTESGIKTLQFEP